MLTSLAWTNPRRLPGVRWVMLKTEYRSLLNLMTMPGRSCVAAIMGEKPFLSGCPGPPLVRSPSS